MSANGFALLCKHRAYIYEHLISQALTSFLPSPATPRWLPPSQMLWAAGTVGAFLDHLTAGSPVLATN